MTFTVSQKSEQVWEQVRNLPEFHASDLCKYGITEKTARDYVNRWEKLGRIRLVRRDDRNRRYFSPSDRPLPGPEPVSGEATPEGNMWRSMRRLGQFSPVDIAAHANAGGVEVTIDKARAYCRQLLGSNHLRVRQTAIPGVREPLYQIVEDTGPRAPRPMRVTGLFDPNTGQFVPANPEIKT